MKTTLELDGDLLRAAKRSAIDRGTSLKGLVELALRRELSAAPRRRRPLRIITAPGGLPPGIESREKMWTWLDKHSHR